VNIFRTIMVALTALMRTKTRSILTMLGVIIGVGAVIAMVSIGEGAKARVAAQFEAMGTSTLIVSGGSNQAGGARGGAGSRLTLTWEDLEAIKGLPEVGAAAPQLRGNAQVVSETSNWQTQINASTPDWFIVRSWKVVAGEQFTAADVYAGSQLGWGMMFGTIEKRPVFEDYVERLGTRPAVRQANRLNEDHMKNGKA